MPQRAPGREPKKGKHRSRRNTVRHGLTAETVIGAIEDAEDYTAFESVIAADYNAQSAVERELVLRLASLLWRLRRATAIEAGLFEIQAENLSELIKDRSVAPVQPQILYSLLRHASAQSDHEAPSSSAISNLETEDPLNPVAANPSLDLVRSFLRLANLPNSVLDSRRYEAALWRQVRQTLVILDALERASHAVGFECSTTSVDF